MRLDLLLVRLRLARSRGLAQLWIGQGHMRRNGQRAVKANQPIEPGDILTLPMHGHVTVIEILALPQRRGPAAEARTCYRVLDAGQSNAIAGNQSPHVAGTVKGNSPP